MATQSWTKVTFYIGLFLILTILTQTPIFVDFNLTITTPQSFSDNIINITLAHYITREQNMTDI